MDSKRESFVTQHITFNNALSFCRRMWRLEDDDKYTLKFHNNHGRIEPFAIAYLSEVIRRYADTKPQAQFAAENCRHHTYAAHMGFFRAVGLDYYNWQRPHQFNDGCPPAKAEDLSKSVSGIS